MTCWVGMAMADQETVFYPISINEAKIFYGHGLIF
jgi:hypothetical protein